MKTTYAFLRQLNPYHETDLNEEYPSIIGFNSKEIDWNDERFICWQPDELDGEQYNLILWCPQRKVLFRGQSIDFDFE